MASAKGAGSAGIPIRFALPKAAYVTLVIDDSQGQRVRNLIAETKLPGGENLIYWDGYEEGETSKTGDYIRNRAPAGEYHVRGIVHDGLHLRYEFSVYGGGNPPWPTLDGSGAWLADHSVPCDVLFLPKGAGPIPGGTPQILVASRVGEAGDTLLIMDEQGNKIVGGPMIDGWAGANAVARDSGPNRDPDYFAYTVNLSKEGTPVHGLFASKSRRGHQAAAPDIATFDARLIGKHPDGVHEGVRAGAGLAVYNGVIVTSVPWKDKLYFFDSRRRAALGSATLPSPKGLAFDAQGRLLVLSGRNLKKYSVQISGTNQVVLTGEETLISGLEDPQRLTAATDGLLYISDWGSSHQVKVFNQDFKLLRTIGNPGGAQLGLYDERRMQYPTGIAVDSHNHVWVAETDGLPKRVSEWSATGELLHAKYGPPRYGGGGTLDPENPDRMFYAEFGGLLEFELDWQRGTSKVKAVVAREEAQGNDPMPGENWLPERPIRVGGRTYLVGGYQGGLRGNSYSAIYLLDEKTHIGRPVAFLGSDRWWPYLYQRPDILDGAPGKEHEHFMAWSDLNEDLKVQTNEFRYRLFKETFQSKGGGQARTHGYRDFVFGPGLEATGSWSIRVPPPRMTSTGVPVFDLEQSRFLIQPNGDLELSEDGLLLVPASEGWLISATAGYRNGRKMWSYREYPDDATIPMEPGQYISPTRLLGPPFRPRGSMGEVFVVNGEMGNYYVFTTDGLFLQTLGGDARLFPPIRLPAAKRGQLMDGMSFEQEHFHPTITQFSNGEICMVAGFTCSSIYQVEGWETAQRRNFGTVAMTAEMAASIPATQVEPHRAPGRQEIEIPRETVQNLRQWKPDGGVVIDQHASVAIAVDAAQLFLQWRTDDPDLLSNAATDFRFLFKKGGGLDLMLDPLPTGDSRAKPSSQTRRLLITRTQGQAKAVLYQPSAPGSPLENRTIFASPVGEVAFDSVLDVSSLVPLEQSEGTYSVRIPLDLLGWNPKSGQKFLADVGVLRGNGAQTLQRAYWNNRDTAIVSDIPSEARLQPANWGVWKIR